MHQEGIAAINRLAQHVEKQRATRETEGYKQSVEPPRATVAEREAIMDQIVDALGRPPKEIQVRLGVSRTTWERWRKMESIPNRSHLEHLRRLMEDNGNESAPRLAIETLPPPLEFLTGSPCTYSRLRVLFSHGTYHWKDAVFHFRTPFSDKNTVVDMASLALNGCRLVYILKSSLLSGKEGERWPDSFVGKMVAGLGRQVSAQVLASLCFVEVSDNDDAQLKEFGVLNFWSTKEEDRVGYIWFGNEQSDAEVYASEAEKYIAKPASDEDFEPLKLQYYPALQKAFDAIDPNARKADAEYINLKKKYRFIIPKIVSGEINESENLEIYV